MLRMQRMLIMHRNDLFKSKIGILKIIYFLIFTDNLFPVVSLDNKPSFFNCPPTLYKWYLRALPTKLYGYCEILSWNEKSPKFCQYLIQWEANCFIGLSCPSDEGLTLETSAFKLSTVASLRYKLSCYTLPPTQHHNFFRNLPSLFLSEITRLPSTWLKDSLSRIFMHIIIHDCTDATSPTDTTTDTKPTSSPTGTATIRIRRPEISTLIRYPHIRWIAEKLFIQA